MQHQVKSRFTIFSERPFITPLPWKVVETSSPNEQLPGNVTTFDLGVGQHERVDHHLTAVRHALLSQEKELESLLEDCKFALWVYYEFPQGEGAFNIHPSIHAALAFLRVELIFHLKST